MGFVRVKALGIINSHSELLESDAILEGRTIHSVPYAQRQQDGLSWVFLVAESIVEDLTEKLQASNFLVEAYDLCFPDENEINVVDKNTAESIAEKNFLEMAVEAMETAWGLEISLAFFSVAEKHGIVLRLQEMLSHEQGQSAET